MINIHRVGRLDIDELSVVDLKPLQSVSINLSLLSSNCTFFEDRSSVYVSNDVVTRRSINEVRISDCVKCRAI